MILTTTQNNHMKDNIRKQIGKLIFYEPFFASIALGLKLEIDPDPNATAWVSGDTMGFGTEFWDRLNPKQQRTLICHEVMHKALLHDLRIPTIAKESPENFRLWNKACDYAINQHLLDPVRFEFPPDGQTDRYELNRFNNQSAEQIFATLFDEAQEKDDDPEETPEDDNPSPEETGGGDGDATGDDPSQDDTDDQSMGDSNDDGDNDDASQTQEWGEVRECEIDDDPEEQIAERKREVRQAMINAKQSGSMPLGLETQIEQQAMKPSVPWESLLANAIGSISPIDFSFQSPKQINNVLLPRFMAETIGRIALIIDTSGSMTPPHLEKAIAETRNATHVFEDAGMDQTFALIYADTEVHSATELMPDDDIPNPKGGGGTDFSSAFEFVDNMDEQPIIVIVITDGFVSVEKTPEADTIFLITPHGSPMFGDEGLKSSDMIVRMSN